MAPVRAKREREQTNAATYRRVLIGMLWLSFVQLQHHHGRPWYDKVASISSSTLAADCCLRTVQSACSFILFMNLICTESIFCILNSVLKVRSVELIKINVCTALLGRYKCVMRTSIHRNRAGHSVWTCAH